MIWYPPASAQYPAVPSGPLGTWARHAAPILRKLIPGVVYQEAERRGYLVIGDAPDACHPWEVLPATGAKFDILHVVPDRGSQRLPLQGDLAIVTATLGDIDVNANARVLGDGRRWVPGGSPQDLVQAIAEAWPTVIEFLAHGDGGRLEGPMPWTRELLEKLLTTTGSERLRLVSFLSCFSDATWGTSLARASVGFGVPRVLAFSAEVEDDSASRLETALIGQFGVRAPEAVLRDERPGMFNDPRMARAAVTARVLISSSTWEAIEAAGTGPVAEARSPPLDANALTSHVTSCEVCARRVAERVKRRRRLLATNGFDSVASALIESAVVPDIALACLTGLPLTDSVIAGEALQLPQVGPGIVFFDQEVGAFGPPHTTSARWHFRARSGGPPVEFDLPPGGSASLPGLGEYEVRCCWMRTGRQPICWEWTIHVVTPPAARALLTREAAVGLGLYSVVVRDSLLARDACEPDDPVAREHAIWAAMALRAQAGSAGVNDALRKALVRSARFLDPLGR